MTNQCIAVCLENGIPINYFSGKGSYFGKTCFNGSYKCRKNKNKFMFQTTKNFV